jgi:hypothetical protein
MTYNSDSIVIITNISKLVMPYLICILFGILVGLSELINRYPDEPKKILVSLTAINYMLLNGVSSIIAFYIIDQYGTSFLNIPLDDIKKVMIASFSSMLFLRSSVFTMKVGSQDVAIGPSAILTIIMNCIDRTYDRERAEERARSIEVIMKRIDYTKAKKDLPLVCLSLMQNLSLEEQTRLATELSSLETGDTKFSKTKSVVLGLTIVKYTGPNALKEAIKILGSEIEYSQDGEKNKLDVLVEEMLMITAKEALTDNIEKEDLNAKK